MRRNHHRLLRAALLAGLALLTAAAIAYPAPPAAATRSIPSSEGWLPVALGTHSFGHLRLPDTIVAKAGPGQVGFWSPPPGADGVRIGPSSFDVARDGSIWLLDQLNHRLLVWQPGQPARPARMVQVPDAPYLADFAVAPDGTIYVTYFDGSQRVPGLDYNLSLAALSPTGQLRWKGPTIIHYFNAQLRVGLDGALYWSSVEGTWTPLTTPTGQLLTVAQQRQRTTAYQLVAGGRRLSHTTVGRWPHHEARVSLADQADHVIRAWRVTSDTGLGEMIATPALVGGDPVVAMELCQQTRAKFLYEYLVLRLGPAGGTRLQFALDPGAVWGEPPVTGVRVGPDGQLYQLRTSPTTGVSIARYSLTPAKATPPATTPGGAVPPSTVTSPPVTRVPAPTVTAPTAPTVQPQPTAPVPAPPAGRSVLPWVMAVAVPALLAAAVGGWRRYRRQHLTGPRRHGQARPAH
ncbi:MAG TPA: hypothetical protein VFN05_10400 [Actinomycetes bacterium]|nr:hypothetical protein [Actinomycetes bacterium]